MKRLLAFVVVVAAALSGAATQPNISELQRLKLVNAYSRALLAQQQATAAQTAFNNAVSNYNSTSAEVIKELGLPAGTTFTINAENNDVTVNQPPAKEKADEAPAKK